MAYLDSISNLFRFESLAQRVGSTYQQAAINQPSLFLSPLPTLTGGSIQGLTSGQFGPTGGMATPIIPSLAERQQEALTRTTLGSALQEMPQIPMSALPPISSANTQFGGAAQGLFESGFGPQGGTASPLDYGPYEIPNEYEIRYGDLPPEERPRFMSPWGALFSPTLTLPDTPLPNFVDTPLRFLVEEVSTPGNLLLAAATAGLGGAAAGALRGGVRGGRFVAPLVEPFSGSPTRAFASEILAGAGFRTAQNAVSGVDIPGDRYGLANTALGIGAGVAGAGVAVRAGGIPSSVIGRRSVVNSVKPGDTLLPDLLPLDEQVKRLPGPREVLRTSTEHSSTSFKELRGAGSLERLLLGSTGINPSLKIADDEVAKAGLGWVVNTEAGNELAHLAVARTLDIHNPRGGLQPAVGRLGSLFRMDEQGLIRNIDPKKPGASLAWGDVFQNPDGYALSGAQRSYIADAHRLKDDAVGMMVRLGIWDEAIASDDLWFPRTVIGIREIDELRRTNPLKARFYDEMADGIANGVRYETDPRAVLLDFVRSAYRMAADKQLSDYLIETGVLKKGTGLLPERLVRQLDEATTRLRDVTKQMRAEHESAFRLRTDTDRSITRVESQLSALREARKTPNVVEARKIHEQILRLEDELTRLREVRREQPFVNRRSRITAGVSESTLRKLEDAKRDVRRASAERSRFLSELGDKAPVKGAMFGRTEEDITVRKWRGKFMPEDDYESLVRYTEHFTSPENRGVWDRLGESVAETANWIRFFSAVGDWGAAMIQGLPSFARHPKIWARGFAKQFGAWFDPSAQSRFIADHYDTFAEMARQGVPVGDVEFFKAVNPGGIITGKASRALADKPNLRAALSPVRNITGRFETSYNIYLNVNRALLWEALEPTWKAGPADLAKHIRNMTGGLSTKALGVGPGQRNVESFALAFSPRLFRSTVALVADAARATVSLEELRRAIPGGGGGTSASEALRSITSLAAAAGGLYVLSGLAMGKDWDEIQEGLDPTNGKKFLSHNINDEWVGVGGQIRGLLQLGANLATTIATRDAGNLARMDPFDNPLLAFYQSRGAVGTGLAAGVIEATTGANTLPYDRVDKLFPDLASHLFTSALPFAIQGIVEGEGAIATTAGLLGLRTSVETPSDRQNEILSGEIVIEDSSGRRITDVGKLTPGKKREAARKSPEFARLEEEKAKDFEGNAQVALKLRQDRDRVIESLTASYIDPRGVDYTSDTDVVAWREGVSEAYREYGFGLSQLPDFQRENETHDQELLRRYREAVDPAKEIALAQGRSEFEVFEELEAAFLNGLSASELAFLESEYTEQTSPLVSEWRSDRLLIEKSGYYDLFDDVWSDFVGYMNRKRESRGLSALPAGTQIADYRRIRNSELIDEAHRRFSVPSEAQDVVDKVIDLEIGEFSRELSTVRRRFREEHDIIGDLIRKWGYGGTGIEELEREIAEPEGITEIP